MVLVFHQAPDDSFLFKKDSIGSEFSIPLPLSLIIIYMENRVSMTFNSMLKQSLSP